MSLRFHLVAALVLGGVNAIPAGPALSEPGSWIDTPKKLPRVQRGDRNNNLEFLFGALKVAPDETSWNASGRCGSFPRATPPTCS